MVSQDLRLVHADWVPTRWRANVDSDLPHAMQIRALLCDGLRFTGLGMKTEAKPNIMSEFNRVKGIEITFDEASRTVNITGFPVEEWSNVLTTAFLYNTLSVRAYKVEREMAPEYSTAENLKWVETRRRRLAEIDNKFKIAIGQTPSRGLEEADDAALEEWVQSQLEYDKLLAGKDNTIPPPPGRPYLHVYRARLKMLELMQLVAYASQTIMGLCRQNHHNRSEFAISKLALMPKLVREITKHMQKFEAEYQATKLPPREEVQPIEKAFGTL